MSDSGSDSASDITTDSASHWHPPRRLIRCSIQHAFRHPVDIWQASDWYSIERPNQCPDVETMCESVSDSASELVSALASASVPKLVSEFNPVSESYPMRGIRISVGIIVRIGVARQAERASLNPCPSLHTYTNEN